MTTESARGVRAWSSGAVSGWLGAALVVAAFGVPLFIGLNSVEMESDEAIYSYAVVRMLETGDWLTPRSIPSDDAFLEKPPLKLWLTAGAIRSGLAPFDDAGLRLVDAGLGALSFLYIYLLGRRLAGEVAGIVAVLCLFCFDRLLFLHGLRTNNMEAAMVLCYAAGVFHFWSWSGATTSAAARRHAYAVALAFSVGFLSKFVAAFFLPLIAIAAFAWQADAWGIWRRRWREWVGPALLSFALIWPWFIYQTWVEGAGFWRVILGTHVVQRFTGSLDVAHLNAWNFYVVETWAEVAHAGIRALVAVGVVRLVILAYQGRDGLARLLLIWAVLPVALMSLGTSKLAHYAYPFWPPVALAAGAAAAWALSLMRPRAQVKGAWSRWGPRVYWTIVAVLAAMAAWTALVEPVRLGIGSVTVFSSSSVVRPLIVGGALLLVCGASRSPLQVVGAVAVLLLLPLRPYENKLGALGRRDYPVREMRDCLQSVSAAGTFVPYGGPMSHTYYYYLRDVGTFEIARRFDADEVLVRLASDGQRWAVVGEQKDLEAILSRTPAGTSAVSLRDGLMAVFGAGLTSCADRLASVGATAMSIGR